MLFVLKTFFYFKKMTTKMHVFGAVPGVGKQAFLILPLIQTMKLDKNQGFFPRYWMQTYMYNIASNRAVYCDAESLDTKMLLKPNKQ